MFDLRVMEDRRMVRCCSERHQSDDFVGSVW